MSDGGAPSLHRWVPGLHWVPAGARGRAGTVTRCLGRGAEPGSVTCDPASPRVFYRRPSSPVEIYFHSWKKSMGCDYCCSRCFLCKQKIKAHISEMQQDAQTVQTNSGTRKNTRFFKIPSVVIGQNINYRGPNSAIKHL